MRYVVTVMGEDEKLSGVGDIYYFDNKDEAVKFYNQTSYFAESSGDMNMRVLLSEIKNHKMVYEVYNVEDESFTISEHEVENSLK